MSSVEAPERKDILRWLRTGLEAVDPTELVAGSLESGHTPVSVIAIGKAAAAMCWGAERALGKVHGICVTSQEETVPDGIEFLIGDHPVPGDASFEAGRRVLEEVEAARGGCIVLVSGGGSSLCEWPRPGVDPSYLQDAHRALLTSGEPIERANLVRSHLSAIKCGGLRRAGTGPFHTLVLSDVAGAGPEVVASGPTLQMPHKPDEAREILCRLGMEVPPAVWQAMNEVHEEPAAANTVEIVGDGLTAASATARESEGDGWKTALASEWLSGDLNAALDRFFDTSQADVCIAAGETCVEPVDGGRGGRNTHAALLAAHRLTGTDAKFAAFATDGVDGSSDAAGALVDGGTIERGGDPGPSLSGFDSASYLARSGDLIVTGPTGTNVADLWILWQPRGKPAHLY